jgi:hypothetical protein
MKNHNRVQEEEQGIRQRLVVLTDLCYIFLKPLLIELNERLDRRLARTFLGLVILINRIQQKPGATT